MFRTRSLVAVLLATAVLAFAACGNNDNEKASTSTTQKAAALTDSFRGVTATSIKLGIAIIDYDCIKQYVDFNRGNQQQIAQSFVDDINAKGGVSGRKIEPVYKTYCPINPSVALDTCQSYTQDDKVFAVVGVFAPTSADAQLCLTRDHDTILIGHELHQPTIAQAKPGLLLTPDITAERRVQVVLNLLNQQGTLKGKTVGILADQDSKASADDVIKPGLQKLGVKLGSTAVLSITGTDTSAAQSQLDSFIEKWKGEGVSALFMAGLNVSAKQFVEKIKTAIPKLLLLTDADSTAAQAQDEVSAGKKPNPYEGMLTATGLTDSELWKDARHQKCAAIYEKASGTKVIGPDELKPGPDGKRVEIYIAVQDFCGELDMFTQIAEKVGPNLTNDSWTKAVNSFGKIHLVPADIASLKTGKYDAADGFRLSAFDSSIQPKGDWKALTELKDASSA